MVYGQSARNKAYMERIRNFTIMSDAFMRNVLKDKRCTEHILRVILGKKDLVVREQTLQADYKNLQGRSAILDCVAQDGDGRLFGVEIQQASEGAKPRRARYYSGLMDMNALGVGEEFENLPETYLIFITRDDVLGYGLPICHIRRRIGEVDRPFEDGSHIIYVNSAMQGDTELGRLMHDFHCKSSDEMYSGVLAARVRELKETPEGVASMCKELEDIYNEGRNEGKREAAFNLSKRGMKEPDIADILTVSVTMVREWLSSGTGTDATLAPQHT